MRADILRYAEVPEMPGVYVLGCFERWVSIYLQQVRGLNLAWALSDGILPRGARVCVVGGGFAGLAAAAGLGTRGFAVTLLERSSSLLATQRNNRVRAIHPHIHEWPRPVALEPSARLPLCSWKAGLAADVAAEVLAGFERVPNIHVELSAKKPELQGSFDAWILALGVGVERSFGALPLRSYWADETIAQIQPGARRRVLVTGIGEGGVIDALYLTLANFSHANIAAELARVDGMPLIENELLAIEFSLTGLDDAAANQRLHDCYARLPVPPAADELLRARLRPDTRVVLNGPEPFALAPRADILNRFLVSRLLALGAVEYLPGLVRDIVPDGTGFVAKLDGGQHRFDDVHIRHGTVPALKAGFPSVWDRYYPARVKLPHLTPEPAWPDGYFA